MAALAAIKGKPGINGTGIAISPVAINAIPAA